MSSLKVICFGTCLLALLFGACGGTGGHGGSASQAASTVAATGATTTPSSISSTEPPNARYLNDGDHEREGDADGDNNADNDRDASRDYLPRDYVPGENSRHFDADDRDLLNYGQAASAAQERAIASVVERYYALAASENGAGACAQLTPSLAVAVPTDYGLYGPSYLHGGKTCAAVLTLLFRHYHRQLSAPMAVTGVRISGGQAYALLGSRGFPAGDIIVQSEAGAWRLAQLLSNESSLP